MSKELDKNFLIQTMNDVDDHNRREEIADCWREHKMIQKSKQYKDDSDNDNNDSDNFLVRCYNH